MGGFDCRRFSPCFPFVGQWRLAHTDAGRGTMGDFLKLDGRAHCNFEARAHCNFLAFARRLDELWLLGWVAAAVPTFAFLYFAGEDALVFCTGEESRLLFAKLQSK